MSTDDITLSQLIKLSQAVTGETSASMRDALFNLIGAILTAETGTPRDRALLARQLAELGDPRPGVCLTKAGLPDVVWTDIPAGAFLMGSDPQRDAEAKEREQPQHSVDLPAFRISRYPVTVAQYEVFVSDGGYANPAYWSEGGQRWKGEHTQPEIGWSDPSYHVSNQPVVGVTWHEAQAFCRWLSERLGYRVRLPSEAEREKAARGDDGRLYPYGDKGDAVCGNVEGTGIGQPCAVGLFLANASPYGVLDLCGNIFEWTSTLFRDYPYQAGDGREDLDDPGSRVFRGGAFNMPVPLSRAAFRSHFYPHACYDWVGFRLCTDG